MKRTITRKFEWDMGHRLTFHKGLCINPHGHRYKMYVTVSGIVDKNGMIIDFSELKKIVNRVVIDVLDHSFMIYENDSKLKEFFLYQGFRCFIVDFETTAENISKWIFEQLKRNGIEIVKVVVYETPNCYAEVTE